MNARRLLCALSVAFTALTAFAPHAHADGGAVVDRAMYGAFDVTVFLSPIPPTEGVVDFSMLISRNGEAQVGLPGSLRAVGPSGIVTEVVFGAATSGNRLLHEARVALELPGTWEISVQIASDPHDVGSFIIGVAPAPAAVTTVLPWMLLWIPIAVLIIMRERLVQRQRATRHAWEDRESSDIPDRLLR